MIGYIETPKDLIKKEKITFNYLLETLATLIKKIFYITGREKE